MCITIPLLLSFFIIFVEYLTLSFSLYDLGGFFCAYVAWVN